MKKINRRKFLSSVSAATALGATPTTLGSSHLGITSAEPKTKYFDEATRPVWALEARERNRYYWFRAQLTLDQVPEELRLRLASTVSYQVFLNGKLCGWGPWRGTREVLWVTEHDLQAFDFGSVANGLW